MSENSEGRGRLTKSVSARFEKAKLEQLQRENERLESIRSEHRRVSTRGSLAGRWEEVLSESKVDEKKKFEAQRRRTISSFLSAYEAGLVQKRISHYESLCMQNAASQEKIQATIRASKDKRRDGESLGSCGKMIEESLEDSVHAIDFYCGSTQTYNFSSSSPIRTLLLNCLLANSRDPLPLLCGVYDLEDANSFLEVVAVAMLDEGSEGSQDEPYIALTINVLPAHETDEGIYGVKRFGLFLPSEDEQGDISTHTLIWDATFNLLPKLASENQIGENSLHIDENISSFGHNESIELSPELVKCEGTDIDQGTLSGEILSQDGEESVLYGRGNGNYVSSSDSSIDEGENTWKEVVPGITEFVQQNDLLTSVSEGEENIQATESDDLRSESITNENTIFSLAKAKGMPEVRQSSLIPAGIEPKGNASDLESVPWTELEVRTEYGSNMRNAALDFHIRDILSSSCTGDSVVFRLKSGVSLLVINSLKSCTHTSNFVLCGDLVFEWVRGVAKSGWLYKWPMKNQKAGMMTRRFFILRDRILSYHRVEPSSQEEASADYSMHSIKLKKGHYVHRSKHHMRACVKLDTVNDALWFRCGSKEEEDDWISSIWDGINRYNRPSPFFWKNRLEMVWHHELPSFQCVGVDAVVTESRYSRAALYRCSLTSPLASPTKRVSRADSFGRNKSEKLSDEGATYSLEFGTNVDNEVHLEVLSLTSAMESPMLLCLKILGDIIMLGGTHGYIGIAAVGPPARYRLELPYSKKLSDSGVCEVICRQYEGHQPEAHVLVIASDEELSLFVSGDSLGGLALWKQRKRTGTAFLGSLKGKSLDGTRINSINFTPQKNQLLVGTSRKLLLLGLWSSEGGAYRIEGLYELESCESPLSCYYSLNVPSSVDTEKVISVWKIVSESLDCTDGMSRASMDGSDLTMRQTQLYRYGISFDVLDTAAKNFQPIVRYRDIDYSPAGLKNETSEEVRTIQNKNPESPSAATKDDTTTITQESPAVKSSWRGAAKNKRIN